MIKECKVLSYKKYLSILVFEFDGKEIQTTATINPECATVFIKNNKDGRYEVVSRNEHEKYINNLSKKKNVKSDKKTEEENSEL